MRKGYLAAVGVAAGLAFSTPVMAQNTSTQTIPLVQSGPGTFTSTFTVAPGAGNFINTFLFQIPQSGRVTVSVSSLQTAGPPTNVNFNATNVRFNGETLAIISRGVFELRTLVDRAVNSGVSTLVVQGSSGAAGTYTGILAYSIPEPATWALMILGFGFTGAALRTRRRRVTFATA